MKHWRPLAIALLLGCSSLFSIQVTESTRVTVPKGTVLEAVIGDLGFDGFTSLDLTSSEELQNQGVAPGDIEETFLTAFSLEAVDPLGADLSFIDTMEIWVEAPGLEPALVAWQDTFPDGEATVDFELEGVDLTDYVVSQSMTLTTDVSGNRPDDDTEIEASFAIRVGVTRQGACNQL